MIYQLTKLVFTTIHTSSLFSLATTDSLNLPWWTCKYIPHRLTFISHHKSKSLHYLTIGNKATIRPHPSNDWVWCWMCSYEMSHQKIMNPSTPFEHWQIDFWLCQLAFQLLMQIGIEFDSKAVWMSEHDSSVSIMSVLSIHEFVLGTAECPLWDLNWDICLCNLEHWLPDLCHLPSDTWQPALYFGILRVHISLSDWSNHPN